MISAEFEIAVIVSRSTPAKDLRPGFRRANAYVRSVRLPLGGAVSKHSSNDHSAGFVGFQTKLPHTARCILLRPVDCGRSAIERQPNRLGRARLTSFQRHGIDLELSGGNGLGVKVSGRAFERKNTGFLSFSLPKRRTNTCVLRANAGVLF